MTNETHNPPIDITTLAWETAARPRDTLPFDPEVDITEDDWRIILNDFRDEKEALLLTHIPLYFRITSIAAAVALLSPQRLPLLGLEEIREDMIIDFLDDRRKANPILVSFTHHLAKTKIGFQKTCEQLGINSADWQNMKKELEACRKNGSHGAFLELGHYMAILYPDRTGELDLDDEIQQKSLQLVRSLKAVKSWDSFAEYAAYYKILFPQHVAGLNTEFDQTTWQQIKTNYPDRHNLALVLCRAFTNLAICAAKKVEITDHGIELVFDRSEPFTKETPPLPVTRKF